MNLTYLGPEDNFGYTIFQERGVTKVMRIGGYKKPEIIFITNKIIGSISCDENSLNIYYGKNSDEGFTEIRRTDGCIIE